MADYNLGNLSVVVVESHSHMRRLLKDVLHQLGIKDIHEAANTVDGLQLFKETNTDLILTDWSPEINGINFLNKIRRGKDTPNPYVPVIIVTAFTEALRVYKARDASMTEFLAKPITAKRLYYRIRSVIENQRHFIRSLEFFGPDRRRRRLEFQGGDRRRHANVKGPDRRVRQISFSETERRQGFPGFTPAESRQQRPIH